MDPDHPKYALTPKYWALVESSPREKRPHGLGPWAVWRDEGAVYEVETIADHFGVTVQEVKDRLSEDGAGVTGGGDGAGDGGDVGFTPVPVDELDADLGQGTVRKTVRNLDQGAVAAIREVTGASSDAEAVREAVKIARRVLTE